MRSALPPLALLAGGLATRMLPQTERVPKSLLVIDGEPFLGHQLRLLAGQGIRDIVLCCGHMGEQIEAFAGDGSRFGCSLRYSYDGEVLLGTGGALRHALPLLGECFFAMYGDSYLPANPVRAWEAFLACGQPALMTVLKNEDQWDMSNVEIRDGSIVCYDKHRRRPAMRYIDYGLSVLQAAVFQDWPESKSCDLADVLNSLATDGRLAAHQVHSRFYEIGSPAGFHTTEQMLAALRLAREEESASVAGHKR